MRHYLQSQEHGVMAMALRGRKSPKTKSSSAKARKPRAAEAGRRKARPRAAREPMLALMIRFDATTIARMDAAASARGLTRSSWLRMLVADALAASEHLK